MARFSPVAYDFDSSIFFIQKLHLAGFHLSGNGNRKPQRPEGRLKISPIFGIFLSLTTCLSVRWTLEQHPSGRIRRTLLLPNNLQCQSFPQGGHRILNPFHCRPVGLDVLSLYTERFLSQSEAYRSAFLSWAFRASWSSQQTTSLNKPTVTMVVTQCLSSREK